MTDVQEVAAPDEREPSRAPAPPAIEITNLARRYGKTDAVKGLSLTVAPGRCHGFLGRNGAGKSTTIKCLLNLLQPDSGSVRVFGLDPRRHEVAVKASIGYVPEVVAFYPWMTVRGVLDYAASFRPRWNRALEKELIGRFGLDVGKKVSALSKGMRSQLALLCAVLPEPDLLLLDEPTSGLDPIVRREFIEAVIGAYQEGAPERRTVFVSTHLINEFEGLIDEFTIIDDGRALLTMEADAARDRFRRVRLRPTGGLDATDAFPGFEILKATREGHDMEVITPAFSEDFAARAQSISSEPIRVEALSLEEIFVAVGQKRGAAS